MDEKLWPRETSQPNRKLQEAINNLEQLDHEIQSVMLTGPENKDLDISCLDDDDLEGLCSQFGGVFPVTRKRKSKDKELFGGHVNLSQGWPLRDGNGIILHLTNPDPASLCHGDSYFCVSHASSSSSTVRLALRHMTHGQVQEFPVLEGDHNRPFTMDWVQNVHPNNNSDLVALLSHCLQAAEDGLGRMTWDRVSVSLLGCHGNLEQEKSCHGNQENCKISEKCRCVTECNLQVNGCGGSRTELRQNHCHCREMQMSTGSTGDYHCDPGGGCDNCCRDQDDSGCQGCHGIHTAESCEYRDYQSCMSKVSGPSCHDLNSGNEEEARSVHRVAEDGRLVPVEPPVCERKVDIPRALQELHQELLSSGVAVCPGVCDAQGSWVVLVRCHHAAWQKELVTSNRLARLLLYYYTLPKEELKAKGLTVITDARGTTLTILNILLETIYMVEASVPGAISIVHVLADRVSQTLLFRSSVFRPQVNVQIDLVTGVETLFRFVKPSELPEFMGGSLCHDHEVWLTFRMTLEPLQQQCRQAAQFLVSVLKGMAAIEGMPRSVCETQRLIDDHQHAIQKVLDDPRLTELQNNGETTLAKLAELDTQLSHSLDFRDSMESARCLLHQVQETMFRLVKMADTRRQRLEQCLQLRQFEEQSTKVMSWLQGDGEEMLSRHLTVSNNLKGIKSQQKDFDKIYFSAMTQLEKGNDMLEEAGILTQSHDFDEVTGIKEVARELKTRMKTFSSRLEDIRDQIENTAKCYHLLDKSYEWALEAMKYVAGMKMDAGATSEGVDKLLTSLNLYQREHPAMPDETFALMNELADKLDNDRLREQCSVAHSRCQETRELLRVRKETLQKAKEQLLFEQKKRESMTGRSVLDTVLETDQVWTPQDASTPVPLSVPGVMLRRRSYAGKASTPIYSPSARAFKDNVRDNANVLEYEEFLFPEGMITEDMSHRVVASLPKGLSDSTLRNSRESLHGSRESLRGSSENLARDQKSSSLPRELPPSLPKDYGSSVPASVHVSQSTSNLTTLNKHNRPHRKMMRRVNSVQTGNDGEVLDPQVAECRRGAKSISMITGSSESLPSMPEEEEVCSAANQTEEERKFVWSPVPVNTHLMSRQSRALPSYHSMADLRMTDEEIKRRRTLSMVMSEMIQTERDYVRSLQFVIDHYMPELLREDVPQALRGKRNVVFGNLEKIWQFHSRYFLSEIENCELAPYQISHCFLQHAAEFYLYALYNKNKPKSDQLMMEYGTNFFRQKQVQLGDRMDLSSYLLKPVQRMGKYALLLKQILVECPETEPEYQDLKSALDMVKFQLRHGNDLLAMDSLRDCDVNLQEQGRLLRQDEFLVWQGRRKCLRHVFLFEDLLLFSKTKRSSAGHDVYVYKNSLKTSDIGLTENIGGSPFRFEIWFRKRTSHGAYIVQAPSADVKSAWIREISRLLWKQAIKNREHRMTEMARMGVGNKPCLDIKPSKDNINDRFVNISVNNKYPRSRNSIAVSSFEHLKNGSKRPHSVISVSSTSSSGSSHSSAHASLSHTPLPPTMEIPYSDATGPLPGSYTTIFSNESGIVPDLNSSCVEDACTQTTLKRGSRRRDSAPDEGLSLTGSDPNSPSSHLLSTDV